MTIQTAIDTVLVIALVAIGAVCVRYYTMFRAACYMKAFRAVVLQIGNAHRRVYSQNQRQYAMLDSFFTEETVMNGMIQGIKFSVDFFQGKLVLSVEGVNPTVLELNLKHQLSAEDADSIERLVIIKRDNNDNDTRMTRGNC